MKMGISDRGQVKSLLNNYLVQHEADIAPSPSNDESVVDNTFLALAAGGPVLLLLLTPFIVWVVTRTTESVIRFLSTPSLLSGVANSAIWLLFTSFAMRNIDCDCLELILAYPMLLIINSVYLIVIYCHRNTNIKAFGVAAFVMLMIGYLFYSIRFAPKPALADDFIGSFGLLMIIILNVSIVRDISVLHGFLDHAIAFANILLNTILNAMTFFVLSKRYPVQYIPIISSFIGSALGLAEMLYILTKACDREGGAQNGPEDRGGGDGHQGGGREGNNQGGGGGDGGGNGHRGGDDHNGGGGGEDQDGVNRQALASENGAAQNEDQPPPAIPASNDVRRSGEHIVNIRDEQSEIDSDAESNNLPAEGAPVGQTTSGTLNVHSGNTAIISATTGYPEQEEHIRGTKGKKGKAVKAGLGEASLQNKKNVSSNNQAQRATEGKEEKAVKPALGKASKHDKENVNSYNQVLRSRASPREKTTRDVLMPVDKGKPGSSVKKKPWMPGICCHLD